MREIYSSVGQTLFVKNYKMAFHKAYALKKIATSLFIFFFIGVSNVTLAQGPGAAWEYSRAISLSAGTPMTDYQVQVKLTAGQYAGINANGSDLRFYVGITPLNYWIEKWDPTAVSVIWVKVPTSGTNVFTMYYGNPAATSTASLGSAVFDYFEDFNTPLDPAVWSYGAAIQSMSNVTVSNLGFISNKVAFTTIPASTSYFLETKHKEASYKRIRYYATTTTGTASPSGSPSQTGTPGDYGYFQDKLTTAVGSTYWNGGLDVNPKVYANTNYITQWKITDNSSVTWTTFNYDTAYNVVSYYTSSPMSVPLRYITIAATEGSGTSTSVDWVRVRKSVGGSLDPASSVGPQIQVPSFNITFNPTSYCAGSNDTITIVGTYLNNTTTVSINGINATTIVPVSMSQLKVVFPGSITTGPIVVTTAGGPATSATSFTINPLPALYTVTGGGSYCAGGAGLIVGLSGSASGVNYQLVKDATNIGGPIAGTGSALSFGLQSAIGSYSVVATNGTNCSQSMTGNVSVVIDPLPGQFNVTGTGSYCSGGPGVAVGLDGSKAGINYQLYSGVTPTAIGAPVPGTGGAISFGVQPAGAYTVKATYNTPTACSVDMIGSALITVNALPTGTLDVSETSGTGSSNDGKICFGDAITFTATEGFSNYIFKVNGAPVVPQPGSNVYTTSTLAVGNPTITVDITDSKTCGSTFTTAPVIISVNARPTGSLAPDVNNVCPGTKVTFNAPTGNSNYVFKVTNGGTLKSSYNNGGLSSYSYTTLVTGDVVSVDVTNSNGCMQPLPGVPMVFKPVAAAAGSITGSATVCQGQNGASFSVPAINNVATTNGYSWTLPAGMSIATGAGTRNITVNFSKTAVSGNISVAGTNECGDGIASVFYITVNPLPVDAGNITGTSVLCQGSSAVAYTIPAITNAASYSWIYTGTGATINNGTTKDITIDFSNTSTSGIFTAYGINACGNGTLSVNYPITVNPLPTATITGNTTVCEAGTNPTITFTGANATAPYTFSYTINSGATQTITSTGIGNTATITAPTNNGTLIYNLIGVQDASLTNCYKAITGASVTVSVNPLPTASIAVSDNKVCQNVTTKPVITFTGLTGASPFTFTYNINGGANQTINTTSGNSVSLNAPVNVSGSFTYNLVSVKSNTTTCENVQTGSVIVTIDTLPVPVLIGNDQICPDQTLDYSTQSGNGINNYIWTITNGTVLSGGGVGTMNSTAEVHWNNNPSPKSILVNYTDGNGCAGKTSVTVVSTAPTAPVITSVDGSLCLNSTGVYKTQRNDGMGNDFTDYVWEVSPGGEIVSEVDNIVTVKWNTAGPQYVKVNFNSGTCSAPAPTVYPVTVNPLPTASVVTNNASVCQNGSAPTITFTGANGVAPYIFSYTINGVAQTDIISTGNSANIPVPTSTFGPFTYQLESVSGNNTCAQVQTASILVTVNPLPTATIAGTNEVCKGSPGPNITFTGSNGTAPYTFTYSINGLVQPTITTITGNSLSIPANTSAAGSFIYALVSVNDVNICTQVVTGQTATIKVNPLPTGTITGPTALCLNEVADITFVGADGTAPYTFTYTINGGTNKTVTTTGNSIDVPIVSSVANTFLYKLISVQDGTTTACVQNQTGSVTVVVSPTSVGGTLTGAATVCSPINSGTLTLGVDKVGTVVRWESLVSGGTWTPISNITSSLNFSNLTDTTQYRAVVQSGTCTEAFSNAVTIAVNKANGGTVVESNKTRCAGDSGSIILKQNSGPVLQWETSTDGGLTWIVTAGALPYRDYLNITQTTWFRALSQATSCATVYSDIAKIIVNARPGATIDNVLPICIGGSTTLTIHLTGVGPITGTLSDGTAFSGTSATPATVSVSPSASTVYKIATLNDANCPAVAANLTTYSTLVVNPLPAPVVINPGNTTICSGTILPLTSVLNNSGNYNPSYTSSSSIAIPDNNATGITSTVTIPAGTIPIGAIFDSLSVNFNITHPDVSDLSINLAAPNGKAISLAVFSLTGQNLSNTIVSSRTSQYPVITTGSSPYTGTYSAEGDGLLIGAQDFPIANTRNFTDLFGTTVNPPNGAWSLKVRDNFGGNSGTLNNWTLKIYYHVPVDPISIIWSPIDSLSNDPSAKVPYTGDARATVYAKPSATTIYTGRASDTNSCTTASNVTVTVTEAPVVTIIADYCAVPNKVQLTASSVPPAYSYIWNTGETTPVIAVDEAKLYTVSARTSLNCVATGVMSIAQELVKNGDFEKGNNGFFSQYGYVAPPGNQNSLKTEGLYAVDTNANNYHDNFFGKDHTTPNQTGKFMIVNGVASKIIWEETVSVLPNTNYYYSAYAMNLNNAGPSFARLQFSVNGVPIGTAATNGIADLSTAPKPTNNSQVNIANWVRFYYGNTDGWNSGTNTTAKIQIINLNAALGGNDFGLDDISFATLSTFISITSAPGTDAQVLCRSTPLTNITYTVGSGGTPTVTGLPNGVTAQFKNGITLIISGTPEDTAGVYHYTITTTGSCSNPTTATGTVTVRTQKVTLTTPAGSDSQSICVKTPITPIKYTLSQLATGAVVNGLPNGVTFSQAGKVITIAGTPTVAGSFTYKIKTSGSSCSADSLTGTINATIQTISTVTNNIQSVCIDSSIAKIVYTIGGSGTGAKVDGLPTGVTALYDPLAKTYTLSGKPAVAGTFNFTVTTLGSCDAAAAIGTITVSANAAISLTSVAGSDAQEICFNTGIINIVYKVTGVVDANITVSGLTSEFSWSVQNGIVTISGTPSVAGILNYTVNATGSCVTANMSGKITVDQPAVAGSLSANFTSLCSTPVGTITLTGSTGIINNWESSTDGSNNWTSIANTTTTLAFSITTSTYFRVVLKAGVCDNTYSNPIQLGVHNLWSGKVSTDWNDANNWSDGNLPSVTCADVVIPGGMPHQPTLGSGSATIINLQIQNGAILTLDNAILNIAGTITNGGTFKAKTGTLNLNSTVNPQTIAANTFDDNGLGNLVINNSTIQGITLAGKLDLYQSLTFGAAGKNLSTGGNLTMKSTATETAWIGDLTGHAINGNVTVERYINIGTQPGQHLKAWEFLAIPTKGQTVNASWMEGDAPGVNSHPGYGTQITGAGGTTNGFDVASPSPSMKYYDLASSSSWTGILNTSIPINNQKGYMLFVRGDRSVNGQSVTTANATTLRTKGQLITGVQNIAVTASPGAFTSIGNPYAAPIDMRKVMLDKTWTTAGNDNFVTVWNSNIGGVYGYGVYQTYTQLNPGSDFVAVPGADVNNYIQSGQAFFIQNTTGNAGNLVIKEQSKAGVSSGLTTYFRPDGIRQRVAQLRTNLFTLYADGTQYLSDGTLQQFDAGYLNAIDGMDGKKIFNISENLSIKSSGKDLIVERRQVPKQQDTIYYSLTNVKVQTYRFEFTASSFSPSVQGYIEDTYLGTQKALAPEGKTTLDFAVTNVAASYAANRFRIVFKTAAALPVTFVSVKGYAKGADIAVEWKVENESNMKQYEVEKSIDGTNFSGVATLAAANAGAGSYNWLDKQASPGYNYYRIKSIDKNGKINYTEIVKVQMGNIGAEIIVFPNPVVNGIINLKFTNQPAGRYNIRLLNALGQMIAGRQVERMEGNGSESLKWDYNLAHGVYQLEITKPNGDVKVIKLMY